MHRFALPPLLVFIVGNLFLPWSWLLFVWNSLALNGPTRNREISYALIAIGIYYAGLFACNNLVIAGILAIDLARYLFVLIIGAGLVFIAKIYVSQAETSELRAYLRQS